MAHRKLLSVDFDGVIHAYDSKWVDAVTIPDEPVPGAFEFLAAAVERYDVAVFSARSATPQGRAAMAAWMLNHGLAQEVVARLSFPETKPPAHLTIDDRAYQFNGVFPDLDAVDGFKPWNKRHDLRVVEGAMRELGRAHPAVRSVWRVPLRSRDVPLDVNVAHPYRYLAVVDDDCADDALAAVYDAFRAVLARGFLRGVGRFTEVAVPDDAERLYARDAE